MGADQCRCSSVRASLLCSHKSALPCQSQDVHPQLFCFRCSTNEQKTATGNRQQGLFQLGEDYDQRLYKDQKWQGHSRFFRPYRKVVFSSTFTYVLCGVYSEGKKNKNKHVTDVLPIVLLIM